MIGEDWDRAASEARGEHGECPEDTSDKGPLTKIHKEFIKLNNKWTSHTIKKWTKDLNSYLTKKDTQMANINIWKYTPHHVSSGKCKLKQWDAIQPRWRHRWIHYASFHKQTQDDNKFKNKKQPELPENRTVWKSDNQGVKEETFIQTGKRGGDRQLG